MPIMVGFMNCYDFYDFWKAVATAFLEILKIPMVNFEIHSLYLFKNFVFQGHKFVLHKVKFRLQTEIFFGFASVTQILCLSHKFYAATIPEGANLLQHDIHDFTC